MKIIFVLLVLAAIAAHSEAGKKCFPVPENEVAPPPKPRPPRPPHRPDPSSQSDCGKNEFFEKCSTKCIEASCHSNIARYCGAGCEAKCLCKDGYVRDADEKCIKLEDCPAKRQKPQPHMVID